MTLSPSPGCVYIVGAGPGDPGLLTLKGAQLLGVADVVLYDDLVDPRILDLAPPQCERLNVGHRGGSGVGRIQEALNEQLIRYARGGKRVVRLKGGDPYVFGRGSEEAMALSQAAVPFEVVSGVSAAAGVPAYAGIPLTHRNISAAAVLITGHEDPGEPSAAVDWRQLAQLPYTLVIFMGSRQLPKIADLLQEYGRPPDTPAAAIEYGTWPRQRTVASTLSKLAGEVKEAGLHSPTLVVVGEVVSLREQLNWFERRPLFGRRILITRSSEQSGPLRMLLEAEGGEVHSLPLLCISPPKESDGMDRALARLGEFDWVLFTSPNSVDFFFTALQQLDQDARALGGVKVAAVGLTTAARLRERGIGPDLLPQQHTQDGLAAAFEALPAEGREFLIPASSIGRTLLDQELERRGATVTRVVAYENCSPAADEVELPTAVVQGRIDVFVFASPSSVRNFAELLGPDRTAELLAPPATIACIGPTTAAAVRDLGLAVDVEPDESSIPALVQAICTHSQMTRPLP